MRIGIDGYNLAMRNGTGVASYGRELAATLHRMGHEVEGVFGLFVPKDVAFREAALFDAVARPLDPARRTNRYQRAWRYLRSFRRPQPRAVPLSEQVDKRALADQLPRFDRMNSAASLFERAFTSFALTGRMVELTLPDPPDVMHWTYPVPVTLRGARNVYTLHDLVPLKLPFATLDDKALYGRIVRACARAAAQICTVSEASKADIVALLGVAPDRVTNTYQVSAIPPGAGVDRDAAAHAVEGIFGLPREGYFLYHGAIEPKKNVGRLLEAYLSLQTRTPLVIVGGRSWQADRELRLMPGGGASGEAGTFEGQRGQMIMRLDYLPRELLAKLIQGARAVVFPSLYEGFGLPVLEAMQLGTPVVTANTGSLPELVGDAALTVDPYDVDALMEAMRRIDGDDALRRSLAARGLERATLFSAERYQERLTELYRAAMARA